MDQQLGPHSRNCYSTGLGAQKLALKVDKGRMTKHSAASGSAAFSRWLKRGQGDIERFGFFGLGLNTKLRHGFTQDEKVLEGVTIGFGDNAEEAGKNKSDPRGFWASMTGATVTIDDKIVMRGGRLLV